MTPKFKRACARAAKLTDENFTAAAMAALAAGLDTPEGDELERRAKACEEEHEKAGELTPSIKQQRDGIWRDLEREIRAAFGQHGVDHANKSL